MNFTTEQSLRKYEQILSNGEYKIVGEIYFNSSNKVISANGRVVKQGNSNLGIADKHIGMVAITTNVPAEQSDNSSQIMIELLTKVLINLKDGNYINDVELINK